MANDSDFWLKLDELVATNDLKVDRPRGSVHPRYPSLYYPLDYGYLEGVRSGDGDAIDVWVGSGPGRGVTAVVCTVDLGKQDAEIKILLGCTPEEAREILALHSKGAQSAILVERGWRGKP